MSASSFAAEITHFAEFVAAKHGQKLSHAEMEKIRHVVYIAFCDSESRTGRAKLDGLECVEWVKKYRAEFGTTLMAAKAAWDSRLAARTSDS